MKNNSTKLYLDLMKKTLSFMLWTEPHEPIMMLNSKRLLIKRILVSFISQILDKVQLQLVYKRNSSNIQRAEGKIRPIYADTMIGLKRLDMACPPKVVPSVKLVFVQNERERGYDT